MTAFMCSCAITLHEMTPMFSFLFMVFPPESDLKCRQTAAQRVWGTACSIAHDVFCVNQRYSTVALIFPPVLPDGGDDLDIALPFCSCVVQNAASIHRSDEIFHLSLKHSGVAAEIDRIIFAAGCLTDAHKWTDTDCSPSDSRSGQAYGRRN